MLSGPNPSPSPGALSTSGGGAGGVESAKIGSLAGRVFPMRRVTSILRIRVLKTQRRAGFFSVPNYLNHSRLRSPTLQFGTTGMSAYGTIAALSVSALVEAHFNATSTTR